MNATKDLSDIPRYTPIPGGRPTRFVRHKARAEWSVEFFAYGLVADLRLTWLIKARQARFVVIFLRHFALCRSDQQCGLNAVISVYLRVMRGGISAVRLP